MDFYSYKLHLYSQNKSDLPMEERMYLAKLKAEELAQKEFDSVKELYARTLSSAPISGHVDMVSSGRMAMAIYQDILVGSSNKVATIQGQSVEQFFAALEKLETFSIENYANQKVATYAETTHQLTNLTHNRGLSAKMTNLFGKGDQARADLVEEMDLLCQQYSVAQDSVEAWSYMPQEERFEYLLGRIENDGLIGFDQKGIDGFGRSLNMIRKEGDFSQDAAMTVTTISFEE